MMVNTQERTCYAWLARSQSQIIHPYQRSHHLCRRRRRRLTPKSDDEILFRLSLKMFFVFVQCQQTQWTKIMTVSWQ